ncbi:MAG: phosphatase [Rhodospirillaceae bacterium]|nr:MAG: phosphatase [Rhodospirillaceae bacterium]
MSDTPARPIKTSLTHPLPIAVIVTPGGGRIGMTLCPGKRQPNAITGPWDRDLKRDLDAIVAFGAKSLITLMEADELAAARVPADILEPAVRNSGLTWHHWPIVDLAAPDARFERAWKAEAGAIQRRLVDGGNIVLHCRGGRGRSGLVAARLLIELGVKPEDAIAAARAAQPLAMETAAQESHIRAYRPTLSDRHGP